MLAITIKMTLSHADENVNEVHRFLQTDLRTEDKSYRCVFDYEQIAHEPIMHLLMAINASISEVLRFYEEEK